MLHKKYTLFTLALLCFFVIGFFGTNYYRNMKQEERLRVINEYEKRMADQRIRQSEIQKQQENAKLIADLKQQKEKREADWIAFVDKLNKDAKAFLGNPPRELNYNQRLLVLAEKEILDSRIALSMLENNKYELGDQVVFPMACGLDRDVWFCTGRSAEMVRNELAIERAKEEALYRLRKNVELPKDYLASYPARHLFNSSPVIIGNNIEAKDQKPVRTP